MIMSLRKNRLKLTKTPDRPTAIAEIFQKSAARTAIRISTLSLIDKA